MLHVTCCGTNSTQISGNKKSNLSVFLSLCLCLSIVFSISLCLLKSIQYTLQTYTFSKTLTRMATSGCNTPKLVTRVTVTSCHLFLSLTHTLSLSLSFSLSLFLSTYHFIFLSHGTLRHLFTSRPLNYQPAQLISLSLIDR